jgi:hypothetical protein
LLLEHDSTYSKVLNCFKLLGKASAWIAHLKALKETNMGLFKIIWNPTNQKEMKGYIPYAVPPPIRKYIGYFLARVSHTLSLSTRVFLFAASYIFFGLYSKQDINSFIIPSVAPVWMISF